MANTYKNIIITPNRDTDAANVPFIRFSGGDASTNTDINVRVYTSQSGTLSFEGSAGQLFSITNDLTNSIFSVNDVSGIPSIDVYANGSIYLAPYGGNISVGGGISFGSTVAGAVNDLSRHLSLWSTSFGISVTEQQINYVVPAQSNHVFYGATTERARINSTGLHVAAGINTSSILINNYDKISAAFNKANNAVLNNATTLITVGYNVATYNASANIAAFGTWQPNPSNGNYQVARCNGAVTIVTPPANSAIDILFINSVRRNPGAVTFSGYNVGTYTGTTYDVTTNNRFILSVREIEGVSTYSWYALQ